MKPIVSLIAALALLALAVTNAFAEVYPTSHTAPGARYSRKVVNCESWVSMRVAPDTGAERAMEVPLGAIVTYCEDFGDFTFAHYEGQAGYILTDYLGEYTKEDENAALSWYQTVYLPQPSSGTFTVYERLTARGLAFLDTLGQTAMEILPEEARLSAIAVGAVPSDADFSAYKWDRVLSFGLEGAENGDLIVQIPIVPVYSQGETLLAVIVTFDGDDVTYTSCYCIVNRDNMVEVEIPGYGIETIQTPNADNVLVVLTT